MNSHKRIIAILIPAHNEELVIGETLKSLLKLSTANDIFVVNDGSTDKTLKIASKYTKNVLSITNHGKGYAINSALKYFHLASKYKYIFFMDADTQPSPNFLSLVMHHFENDSQEKIVCVAGRVKSLNTNWLSKYRQWEYHISHFIHKKAQEKLNCMLVVPGCATIYRSIIFQKLQFPDGTLTEDMDFTFMMHRAGLSNMVFEDKAIVYTQDPQNIRDFVKQLRRWYTGFWQVVKKHDIPWHGHMLDLEVAILALEGIYNGLAVLFFIVSFFPLFLFGGLSVFKFPLLFDFFVFFIPSLLWSVYEDRDITRILYIPQFYLLRLVSSIIFLRSFFDGFLSIEKQYVWNTKRYILGKEVF